MALESKGACIWHAFNALDEQQAGEVNKSQLKVLSHNICMSVGVASVMSNISSLLEALDEQSQNPHLTFLEYYFFIKTELFDKLRHSGEINANADLSKCDEVCWLICSKKYLKRELEIIKYDEAFKLFQLFNFLAEVDPSGAVRYPVIMDPEEVNLLAQKFCKIVGFDFDNEEFEKIAKEIPKFNFQQVLVLLETQYCRNSEPSLITSAINEIHAELLVEVIKQGVLTKKGQRVSSWKERWFVLTPHRMSYYTARDEKDKKGELYITSNSKVESLPDKADKFHSVKTHKFTFHSDNRVLEMGAPDVRTRSEWVTAIKNAIEYCNKPQSPQQMALSKRRQLREQRRKRAADEEMLKRQKEEALDKTRQELEKLQQAHKEAEERIKEEERLREENLAKSKDEKERLEQEMQKKLEELGMAHAEADAQRQEMERLRQEEDSKAKSEVEQQLEAAKREKAEVEERLAQEEALKAALQNRIQELEMLQSEMEQHLEEEIQAKRDEEIVRAAQARVLNEEIEKREELEKIKQQLDNLLVEEVQKRKDLEEAKVRQEQSLQQTLESLEMEKKGLDEQLKEAQEKMEKAQEEKASVRDQMNVKEKEKFTFMARLNKLLMPWDKDPNPVSHRGKGAVTLNECNVKARKYSIEKGRLPADEEEPESDKAEPGRTGEDSPLPALRESGRELLPEAEQNDVVANKNNSESSDDPFEPESDNKMDEVVEEKDEAKEEAVSPQICVASE